jgi:hypothetical protein
MPRVGRAAAAGGGWLLGGGGWPAGPASPPSRPSIIPTGPLIDRPPTERQVGEPWRHRQAASQRQAAADATLKRVLAREHFSIPNRTPARLNRFARLDEPPPVGVVQFEQPSGLPVLTMALDPASMDTGDADLDARMRSHDVVDVLRHRWWTLRSESLEVLPSGTWRVMATLTANGASSLVELRLDLDPDAGDLGWLGLRGHGLVDRRAFGIATPAATATRRSGSTWPSAPDEPGAHTCTQRNGQAPPPPTSRPDLLLAEHRAACRQRRGRLRRSLRLPV